MLEHYELRQYAEKIRDLVDEYPMFLPEDMIARHRRTTEKMKQDLIKQLIDLLIEVNDKSLKRCLENYEKI